jgi:eukaryotic-like serine/threonine-protein kinase
MNNNYIALKPNTKLKNNQYRVIKLLAKGGMGAVYKSVRTGPDGFVLPVAIKELLPHLSEKKALVELFFSEAKLHANLNHSNIVRVVDLFVDGGQYYIVMEWVEGMDLRTAIKYMIHKHFSLPLEVGIFILHELLLALKYSHTFRLRSSETTGIIHRDISPSNILLSCQGEVKLTDFGISQAGNRLDKFKKILGKKGYMPPEILGGEIGDSRSDIYSLMVCFCESLTLVNPVIDNNSLSTLRSRPDISQKLWAIISHGLTNDYNKRPNSSQLLEHLESLMVRESISISSTLLSDFLKKLRRL